MEEYGSLWMTIPLAFLLHLLGVKGRPMARSYGRPDFAERGDDGQPGKGVIADEIAYNGEPWMSEARRQAAYGAWAILGGLALLLIMLEPLVTPFAAFLEAQAPLILWAVFLAASFAAFCVGGYRQINNLLMERALAIPARDSTGQLFLIFVGDVPSMAWQYSAMPRVRSFAISATLTIGAAFPGAILLQGLSPVAPATTFLALVALRVLASYIAARLLLGDFGGFQGDLR